MAVIYSLLLFIKILYPECSDCARLKGYDQFCLRKVGLVFDRKQCMVALRGGKCFVAFGFNFEPRQGDSTH